VVVSGGGTGIGRAIAARFAEDGDRVVVVGRRASALDAAAAEINSAVGGALVTTVAADLSEPDQVERARDEIIAAHGQVDVLVNNAGGNVEIGAPADTVAGVAGAAWHWLGNFRSNVLTTVLLTEALKDRLADQGGRVILLSSIAAFRGSGTGSYAGTKAALHPYSFDLAAELGPRGITVNTVAPGYIQGTEFFRGRMSAELEQSLISKTALKRGGTTGDVADVVHWLASPRAQHVTGEIVQLNGGELIGR